MAYHNENILDFSKILLRAANVNGSRALGLNKGVIEKDFDSDMITFTLPDKIEEKEDLPMHIILHTKFVDNVIIGGEFV